MARYHDMACIRISLALCCLAFSTVSGASIINGNETKIHIPFANELKALEISEEALMPLTVKELQVRANAETPPNCPVLCPINTVTVGTRCFRYEEKAVTWREAKKDCEDQNGFLAIPDLSYNQLAVELGQVYRNIIGKGNIWIGATDVDSSSVTWKWVDGSALQSNHPHWHPGHPGDYVFDGCAQIYKLVREKVYMVKESCNYKRYYLCEFIKPERAE